MKDAYKFLEFLTIFYLIVFGSAFTGIGLFFVMSILGKPILSLYISFCFTIVLSILWFMLLLSYEKLKSLKQKIKIHTPQKNKKWKSQQ